MVETSIRNLLLSVHMLVFRKLAAQFVDRQVEGIYIPELDCPQRGMYRVAAPIVPVSVFWPPCGSRAHMCLRLQADF